MEIKAFPTKFYKFWKSVFRVLLTWLRSFQLLETKKQRNDRAKRELVGGMGRKNRIARWEQDYILNPAYEQFLFDEYLEMGWFLSTSLRGLFK